MLHGTLSSVLGRGLAIVVSAVTLPLTVRYLGQLEYGIWVTISSTVVMLSVLDLGIANTLTNFLSESHALNDRERARTYFATGFWLTVGVTVVLAALSALLWRVIDWGALLHLTDTRLVANARIAVAISILYFLLTLPLNLANRVLASLQQTHLANYFAMINSLLGLVAIVGVVLLRGGLVELMATYCAAMLLGSVTLNAWLMLRHTPWIRPHPRRFQRDAAEALSRQGFLFFIIQLTTLVVFNSDNLVITHFVGAQQVTPYSIAWRLAGYAALLQSLLIPSFWPAFTEAYHRQDMDWVRSTYRAMTRKTLLAVASAALLMGLFGRMFIRVWAGQASVPSATLLWTMAFWAVLVSATTNQALLMTATGRLRVAAVVAVLAATANLAGSILLVRHMGPLGVILATVLSFAVFIVVPQQMEVARILRGEYLPAGSAARREDGQLPLPILPALEADL